MPVVTEINVSNHHCLYCHYLYIPREIRRNIYIQKVIGDGSDGSDGSDKRFLTLARAHVMRARHVVRQFLQVAREALKAGIPYAIQSA